MRYGNFMNLTTKTKLENKSRTWEWTDGSWKTKEECAEILGISPQGFYQRWTRTPDDPVALSRRGRCKPPGKPLEPAESGNEAWNKLSDKPRSYNLK